MSDINLESIITCPECGHAQKEIMPVDSCQYFYECAECEVIMKPKADDCCVFCSYGTNPCPSIQKGDSRSCC